MSTPIDDILLSLGARTKPRFPPLERHFIYLTGKAKTGKSTLAASFPGVMHVDHGAEAMCIAGRRGTHVWCPVYTKDDLSKLKESSPRLFVKPAGATDDTWQPPTSWEHIREALAKLALLDTNPVTGVCIDSMEDMFDLTRRHYERNIWRMDIMAWGKGPKGYGVLRDAILDDIQNSIVLKGYGCIPITHQRVSVDFETKKEEVRSGISEALDSRLRDVASFIWTMDKTKPFTDPKTGKDIQRIDLKTELGTDLRKNLGVGNRVSMPTVFKELPLKDAFTVVNGHYQKEVAAILSQC